MLALMTDDLAVQAHSTVGQLSRSPSHQVPLEAVTASLQAAKPPEGRLNVGVNLPGSTR
jgi:hypothetical protein